ncbi:glycosyltransferase family 2 protein, partial [Campylobacter jejuni]|nr:glycosyltransferase family 2 protein [Campylobacter jejuni]ELF7146425.1 glycosyltransferase family 2 protein [Campylobacter jejuni]
RIKIIHNEENLGLLRARYEGVKAAGGGGILCF